MDWESISQNFHQDLRFTLCFGRVPMDSESISKNFEQDKPLSATTFCNILWWEGVREGGGMAPPRLSFQETIGKPRKS